jgi:hypothetical protein
MDLYRSLDDAYQYVARRPAPPPWQAQLGDLDLLVCTIRDVRPDAGRSDTALRRLLGVGRDRRDALTVALYALAPALRARTSRAVSDDYRADALAELTFVLLDSPLDRAGLAHRLVNRAHNRVYKAARRVHQRGVVHTVTTTAHDPDWVVDRCDAASDIADVVAQRVDLGRFHAAVTPAIADGRLSPTQWAAYRDHRLRRAVDPTSPACDGVQRKLASRATAHLQPLIDTYLHAA